MLATTEDLALARGLAVAIQAEADESAADYSLRCWEATERAQTMARHLAAGDEIDVAAETQREIHDLTEQRTRHLACVRLAQMTATAYAGVDDDAAEAARGRAAAYLADIAEIEAALATERADLAELGAAETAGTIEAAGHAGGSYTQGRDGQVYFEAGEPIVFE